MDQQGDIRAVIRDILLTTWPQRFVAAKLDDEIPLGEDGLGLDSVEIAEVLLACEERCGIQVDEALFGDLPVTIQGMADGFAAALA